MRERKKPPQGDIEYCGEREKGIEERWRKGETFIRGY
jgi:hypothetical protein